MAGKSNHIEFIEKFKQKQPKLFEKLEILGEYVKSSAHILVKDLYGKCLTKPNNLLNGKTPTIKSAVNPHEYFLNNLKDKHLVIFESLEFLSKYEEADKYILVKDKYGICKTTPSSLLAGHLPTIQSAIDKTEYFANQLKTLQPELFDKLELVSEYKDIDNPILVKDEFGICKSAPWHLLEGKTPSIMSAISPTEYFIEKAKKVHGDLYDYSKVEYKKGHIKVEIFSKYGSFWQTPDIHLNGSGCPELGKIKISKAFVSNTEEFIEKAKKVHGNKYNYSLVDYKNSHDKVKIISSKGVFEQSPTSHLRGAGCPKLSALQISINNQENPKGWSYSIWEEAANKSKHFDSFKCYIIQVQDSNKELFYKIGKTFTTLERRFKYKSSMPYNYLEIKVFTGNAREISELEKKLQKAHKKFKYLPKKKFEGMYECFSEINLLTI